MAMSYAFVRQGLASIAYVRGLERRIEALESAIAAGTQRAETAKHGSVPKGCQSGGEAASPNTSSSTGE